MTVIGDTNDPATVLNDADLFFRNGDYLQPSVDEEAEKVKRDFDGPFAAKLLPDYWWYGRLTAALVQVYDLVAPIDARLAGRPDLAGLAGDVLERLGVIARELLLLRDDKRTFPRNPIDPDRPFDPRDEFRGRVMPAWGGHVDYHDWKWNTDVVTAGLFVYAMAAFARRAVRSPALRMRHGGDAIWFITATLDTFDAFGPELHFSDDDPHAYFTMPLTYRHPRAGKALAHNQTFGMMQALAEVALAADSFMYRHSVDATPHRLRVATEDLPLLIAKNVAYFAHHLVHKKFDKDDSSDQDGSPYFLWYREHPGEQVEDTAHAQLSLASLAIILEHRVALNALLARAGRSERIPSPYVFAPMANTFLRKVWQNNSLADKVNGEGDEPASVECAGWLPWAQFDPWVWKRSRDTVFGPPLVLRKDNHAALLRYRKFSAMKYLTEYTGQNWLIVPVARAVGEAPPASIQDQRWLLVLTGVVIADHKGDHSDRWHRQTVSFMPDMAGPDHPSASSGPLLWAISRYSIPKPAGALGANYLVRFSVDAWLPSVSPSAIFNKDRAVDCGFAVEASRPSQFETGTNALTGQPVGNLFAGVDADLAAREMKGWMSRLGYHVTLIGKIVFVEPAL